MDASPGPDLSGRKLLLGVCGGIAAYKIPFLVRLLKKAGAEVQVVMTPDAARFVAPLTLGTLSEREILVEIFPENAEGSWTRHVTLGLWADLFVVAPATAQTLAKLAHGHCDSMLTAIALSARCPLLLCPSMDHDMYEHPATQANLATLRGYGYHVMEPASGPLASGLTGVGRLPEPEDIFVRIVEHLDRPDAPEPTLRGKTVLVTAGPTREAIDPVRFVSNPSTGTMGVALTAAARDRGAEVVLVSGPTAHAAPEGVTQIDVVSADDMHRAVRAHADADLVLMAAAVADYRPARPADRKLKKTDDALTLTFERTADILAELGREKRPDQVLVGFAMETDDGLAHAREKLERKNLDWIALNNLREPGAGFGTGTNRITLLGRDGSVEELPLLPKSELAGMLLDRIVGR